MYDRTDLVTIATAVWLAGYAAMALWYVALFDIGLTREGVRIGATVAAILLGVVLALDFLVRKLAKRK
jgi:formate-dependent nitrite reductase membrane component NrfD